MIESAEPDSIQADRTKNDYTPDFLSSASIAIIGLGLIGGSLALALHGQCRKLLGIDRDQAIVNKALERQLVDLASTDPLAILPMADMVIIAVPLRASLELIKKLPQLHPGSPIVIDVGSTKSMVVQAMSSLPDRFDSLGGHPMCGKENGTLDNAEAGLFGDAIFALIPTERTSSRALEVSAELIRLIGAIPLVLEADQHDHWIAATSHVPHLLATALTLCTPLECGALVGPGFRSTSRLAAGCAEMKTDIFATNRQSILEALTRFTQQLNTLTALIEDGDMEGLHHLFDEGAKCRIAILDGNDGIR